MGLCNNLICLALSMNRFCSRVPAPAFVALLLLSISMQANSSPRYRSYALIIGYNESDSDNLPDLRYADDDAVQNAKLLSELDAHVVLLTDLDDDSRELYPDIQLNKPTKQAVFKAMEEINTRMEQARKSGYQPIFYLFYSGHGEVEHNRGYVTLQGDRLWRRDLLDMLESSKAMENHVIIDACKSYFMVFKRGPGGERKPVHGILNPDNEEFPVNTGVFLSTSSAGDSHEWEAYQAGVFSHELRSALRGAADVNRNNKISYEEAAAFIWTANASIANRRFRPAFYQRPPKNRQSGEASLMRLSEASGDRLVVGPGFSEHIFLEDAVGARLADLHPGESQAIALILPAERPLFARNPVTGKEVALPQTNEIHLAGLHWQNPTSTRRGAEHEAFASLFSKKFDQQAQEDYLERLKLFQDRTGEEDDGHDWLRYSLGIAAAATGITGGVMTGLALAEKSKIDDATNGVDRARFNDRIDAFNVTAISCYSVAGGLLAGFLFWTLWPEKESEVHFLAVDRRSVSFSFRF